MSKVPPGQGGPKPLTKADIEATAKEICDLEKEAKRLAEEAHEIAMTRDVQLKEAKRVAAESRVRSQAPLSNLFLKIDHLQSAYAAQSAAWAHRVKSAENARLAAPQELTVVHS